MTDRSRTLTLSALREKARIAVALCGLREVTLAQAEAAQSAHQLEQVLAVRQGDAPGTRLFADIRAERHLTSQLTAEAERMRAREAALLAQLAQVRSALARQEHRFRTLSDRAAEARAQDTAAREDRNDAAQPNAARRGGTEFAQGRRS
jgi:hypothetical protein